jgi:hypothetical protein
MDTTAPQAAALITALADRDRGFDAVVVGEPQRAFYGNQFGNTFPLFAHYGVPLWVPEVGGPIDPLNEAHDALRAAGPGGRPADDRAGRAAAVPGAGHVHADDPGRPARRRRGLRRSREPSGRRRFGSPPAVAESAWTSSASQYAAPTT